MVLRLFVRMGGSKFSLGDLGLQFINVLMIKFHGADEWPAFVHTVTIRAAGHE